MAISAISVARPSKFRTLVDRSQSGTYGATHGDNQITIEIWYDGIPKSPSRRAPIFIIARARRIACSYGSRSTV